MKFRLTRSSIWSDEKPLDDPRVKLEHVDRLISPDNYNIYVIELNNLEELIELVKQCQVVIYTDDPYPVIEIYDSWRE